MRLRTTPRSVGASSAARSPALRVRWAAWSSARCAEGCSGSSGARRRSRNQSTSRLGSGEAGQVGDGARVPLAEDAGLVELLFGRVEIAVGEALLALGEERDDARVGLPRLRRGAAQEHLAADGGDGQRQHADHHESDDPARGTGRARPGGLREAGLGEVVGVGVPHRGRGGRERRHARRVLVLPGGVAVGLRRDRRDLVHRHLRVVAPGGSLGTGRAPAAIVPRRPLIAERADLDRIEYLADVKRSRRSGDVVRRRARVGTGVGAGGVVVERVLVDVRGLSLTRRGRMGGAPPGATTIPGGVGTDGARRGGTRPPGDPV